MARLTADQVIGLAPDASSVAAGRKLAAPATWSGTGCTTTAVWGLAQGSGKNPYQTAVDLSGPAYKCSCPSRKIPCKHVLGLLLLWSGGAVGESTPAPFAEEWLQSRAERAEAGEARAQQRAAADADPEARAKRQAKRSASIDQGLDDLRRLLTDLVRHGLAAARERPASTWEQQARRLVDAQAPGLAARVRELGHTLHAGHGDWPRAALTQAAMLHLATMGWRRGEALPEDLRDDVRAVVGWSRTADDVRASTPALSGPWAVVGIRVLEQDRLRVRRTWLLRLSDARPALLLDFAAGPASFGPSLVLGSVVDGDLHPYPGRSGLRAIPAAELRTTGGWDGPPASATATAAVEAWSAALAADPFVERIPVALAGVIPAEAGGRWWATAGDGPALPLDEAPGLWDLIALSGAQPLGVAGEYDGHALRVLCAHSDGRAWRIGADAGVQAAA
jgi:hypothetical protein